MTIQNAIIESTDIFIQDHNILTCYLYLKLEIGNQGFGGYCLDDGIYSKIFIRRVLETTGVRHWKDLSGKTIRVSGDKDKIDGIGHIVNENWFFPQREYGEKE